MGSAFYKIQQERQRILILIANGNCKYLCKLIGTYIETGYPVVGAYSLYEEFNEENIKSDAKKTAKENDVKLSKIEVLSLKAEVVKEIIF